MLLTGGLNPEIYDAFMRKLVHPDNALVYEAMRVFVDTFVGSCDESAYPDNVKSFCASVRVRMYALPLWTTFARLNMPSGLADALTECIEIWAATQLYSVLVFRNPADLEHDKTLFDQLASLVFLTPAHLEIPQNCWQSREWNHAVQRASETLFQISKFKTPLQKLMVIHKTVQIISDYTVTAENGGGADVLLPMLVWVLVCANPPQLYTSIQFISDFRNRLYKGTQLEYNLVSVHSALEFVEDLKPSDLHEVDATQFEELKERSLRGEIQRWHPPIDDPLADFVSSSRGSTAGAPGRQAEDWVMLSEPSRPLFLWCPQNYNVAALVEHLRFVYNAGKLILSGSDEVRVALPEIAFGAKASNIMLIVVGYKPVDWMQHRKVRGSDAFNVVELLIEAFASEKKIQLFEERQLGPPVEDPSEPPPPPPPQLESEVVVPPVAIEPVFSSPPFVLQPIEPLAMSSGSPSDENDES